MGCSLHDAVNAGSSELGEFSLISVQLASSHRLAWSRLPRSAGLIPGSLPLVLADTSGAWLDIDQEWQVFRRDPERVHGCCLLWRQVVEVALRQRTILRPNGDQRASAIVRSRRRVRHVSPVENADRHPMSLDRSAPCRPPRPHTPWRRPGRFGLVMSDRPLHTVLRSQPSQQGVQFAHMLVHIARRRSAFAPAHARSVVGADTGRCAISGCTTPQLGDAFPPAASKSPLGFPSRATDMQLVTVNCDQLAGGGNSCLSFWVATAWYIRPVTASVTSKMSNPKPIRLSQRITRSFAVFRSAGRYLHATP